MWVKFMMTTTSRPEISAAESDRATLRRSKIVATARQLFAENGFHATGVAQIAARSGVAVGQLYRDFSSKEAIVASIAQTDCLDYLGPDSLRRDIERGDAEAAWAWLREFMSRGDADGGVLITEIVAEATRNPTIAAMFQATSCDVRRSMLAAIEVLAPGQALAQRRAQLADLALALSLGLHQHRVLETLNGHDDVVETAIRLIRYEIDDMRRDTAREVE